MVRIIVGLAIIVVGFLLVRYSNWIVDSFGYLAWAEDKLGSGGSRTAWRLIGLVVILVGFLVTTGFAGPLAWQVLGRLFGTFGNTPGA